MAQSGQLPLKLRLKAWWEGYDPEEVARRLGTRTPAGRPKPAPKPAPKPGPHDASPVNPDDPELPFDPWDSNRVEIAQYIWGEGYCGPGGPEHIVSMSKLLALSPEQSLLEIGSHLGGPARTLADSFGVWVTGYEQSPRLVELANEKSVMAGLAKKAIVKEYDPDTIEHFERKFDRVFAKEAFFTIGKKDRLFSLIEETLKPSGLFLLTDFVLGSDGARSSDEYKEWRDGEAERRRPFMVTAPELVDMLKKARFIVRVNEDVSDHYVELVNHAWAGADKVAARIAKQEDGEELLKTLVKEAEYWNRRVRLLRSGALRVWRILASKKADKPSMMSDW